MPYKSSDVEKPDFVDEEIRCVGIGIECQVYEIVAYKLVCKIYASHADARYSYTLQRIGFRAGIAPEPMGLERNYYFSRYVESWNISNSEKYYEDMRDSEKFQNFVDKVEKLFGGHWKDCHGGNIGVIKQNSMSKYLVIDFGIAGFNSTKLGSLLSAKLKVYFNE